MFPLRFPTRSNVRLLVSYSASSLCIFAGIALSQAKTARSRRPHVTSTVPLNRFAVRAHRNRSVARVKPQSCGILAPDDRAADRRRDAEHPADVWHRRRRGRRGRGCAAEEARPQSRRRRRRAESRRRSPIPRRTRTRAAAPPDRQMNATYSSEKQNNKAPLPDSHRSVPSIVSTYS